MEIIRFCIIIIFLGIGIGLIDVTPTNMYLNILLNSIGAFIILPLGGMIEEELFDV